VIWAAGAVLLRAWLLSPEVCPQVSAGEAVADARAAAAWMARVQEPDGSYLYEFDLDKNEQVPGYNAVRHAGVTMALYQLAAAGEASSLPAADRGLAWMRARLYEHDGWAAIRDDAGGVETGGSALLLAGLAQRRLATGDTAYDDFMRQVGRFLVVMQQDDGSFLLNYDIHAGAPDPSERSKYATGEAFWSLTLMHRAFPGEGWDVAARRTADYLSLRRDTVEGQNFPPWADQWAAYGLAEMADWPLDDANVAYARALAERFGFLVRVESQRTDGVLSKLFHGRRSRGAGMGTWSEALDSLWRLSGADPRLADLRDEIGERAACAAGMLHERQLSAEDAADTKNPPVAEGAWFTEGLTRMDDQQHSLSGLLRSAAILDERKRPR